MAARQMRGVFASLRRERVMVHPVGTRMGVRAGQLLGRVRAGSELAVDAFLIAVADLGGGAVGRPLTSTIFDG